MSSLVLTTKDADGTRRAAEALAGQLRAGDLVVLDGPLGAGKTTFTQGVGAGLGVRGPVASPTFVIERVHPSLTDGPSLVHVDAYRLGPEEDLDDLDLEADLDHAVTLIEWGRGRVEHLVASWLLVQLERPAVDAPAAVAADLTACDLLVGSGTALYPELLPGSSALAHADAGHLLQVASALVARGEDLSSTEPLYLREPDAAKPTARKSALGR